MTVGEKIQYYRKRCGLSQEELGQKLLVSRQTVSLWEMDKTLPTVDNLRLLQTIFSVSLDELLSDAVPQEPQAGKEKYSFRFDPTELRLVFREFFCPRLWRVGGALLAMIALFVFLVLTDAPDVLIGIFLGLAVGYAVWQGKKAVAEKKAWEKRAARMAGNTYVYEVFDGFFTVTVFRGETQTQTQTQTVPLSDAEDARFTEHYAVLSFAGQGYLFKKEALAPDSVFLAQEKRVTPLGPRRFRTASLLSCLLSVASPAGALICVGILTGKTGAMTEHMWVFFLFLPFPLALIALGIAGRKKGYPRAGYPIVGVIMAVILCIFGSFTFLFADVYSHDPAPVTAVGETLGLELPDHTRINTTDWTRGTQSVSRGYIYSVSDVFFAPEEAERLAQMLSDDARFLPAIPSGLVGISSPFCDVQPADYYLIYNEDTGVCNELPDAAGSYRWINLLYHTESQKLTVVEYRLEYNP